MKTVELWKTLLGFLFIAIGIYAVTQQDYSAVEPSTPIIPQRDTNPSPPPIIPIPEKPKTDLEKEKIRKKLDKIRKTLKPKMDGENWRANIFPNSELVKGLKGRYYVIDLINARTKEVLQFNPGEYVIDDFKPAFQTALADFGVKIQSLLEEGKVDYKIFVKGSADIAGDKTFKSDYHSIYQYPTVGFYKKHTGKSKFITDGDSESIPEPFYNKHLPNLRASFICEKLSDTFFELKKPIILDGSVTLKVDEKDRNATIFLFLPKDLFIIN